MAVAASIDEYIEAFPAPVRAILSRFRELAHETDAGLTEAISYGVPTMRLKGKNAFHFGAYPHHVSVYPVPADSSLRKQITPYIKGKGTLQFPLSQDIPYDVVSSIFAAHVVETRQRLGDD